MNEHDKKAKRRRDLKRVQLDAARDMRDVKRFDSAFVAVGSEIQLVEGGIIADRDEFGVYAEMIFKNLSEKALKRLKIRMDFYYYQNIPYGDLFFEYCADDITFGKIKQKEQELKHREALQRTEIKGGETFGEGVYIPMPESAYTKLAIYICEIEFTSGEVITDEISLCGKGITFSELDEISKRILKSEKRFERNERVFPTKNLPQFSENGWLCCRGYKNPAQSEICEKCKRERELQRELISEAAINERKRELASQPTAIQYHDKSRFAQNKYLQNAEDRRKREEEIKRSRENLAKQQELRRRRESHWLKRGLLLIITVALFWVGFVMLAMFKDAGNDTENAGNMFHRIMDGDDSLFDFFGFNRERTSIFDVWEIFQQFDYN